MHGRKKVLRPGPADVERAKREMELQQMRAYNGLNARLAQLASVLRANDDDDDAKGEGRVEEAEEKGKEVQEVTASLLLQNPEHYTAWNWRRRVLLRSIALLSDDASLETLLDTELSLGQQCIRLHPKSYWVWNHRRWVVSLWPVSTAKSKWEHEVGLCHKLLDLDGRNFHCWDYRRFLLRPGGPIARDNDSELQFTMKKLSQNFSNYSAWHLRSKLLAASELPADKEFELINSAVYTEPADQSAWLYHHWICGQVFDKDIPVEARVTKSVVGLIVMLRFHAAVKPLAAKCTIVTEVNSMQHTFDCCWRDVKCGDIERYRQQWVAAVPLHAALASLVKFRLAIARGTFRRRGLVDVDAFRLDICFEGDSPVAHVAIDTSTRTDIESICRREMGLVHELADLEPDSKWPLLTLTRLYVHLTDENANAKRLAHLERLKSIDPMRQRYYEHALQAVVSRKDAPDDLVPRLAATPGSIEDFMLMTGELALQSIPVPTAYCVGAVLTETDSNLVLATGFSRELPGNTHAEQVALTKFNHTTPSSHHSGGYTLYCSMQPCVERLSGQQPCADCIVQFARQVGVPVTVVFACAEPTLFIQDNGERGTAKLRAGGVEVVEWRAENGTQHTMQAYHAVQQLSRLANGHLH